MIPAAGWREAAILVYPAAACRGFPGREPMVKFLLWCILFVLCWPVALLALVLYPLVWILLLPFRLVGITVRAVFDLLAALLALPSRLLRGPQSLG